MTTFLVERRLPGLTREHLALVQRSLHAVASTGGATYARSFWIPAQDRCLCVFEAASLELVTRVNDTAQVPFVAVTEALQLLAPGANLPARAQRPS